jgi:hypothetical protein
MGLVGASAGSAELMEWSALFQQAELFAILEGSVTSVLSKALRLAGLYYASVVSAEGKRQPQSGLVRAMQSGMYRTRGNILRELDRLDAADEAYRRVVARAHDQGWLSRKMRALTSLLDLQLSRGQSGDLSAALRPAMAVEPRQSDRPDRAMAREVDARICSETPLCKESSCL